MKLKRILAVALSVATVAGTGVMAVVSADAKVTKQWELTNKTEKKTYKNGRVVKREAIVDKTKSYVVGEWNNINWDNAFIAKRNSPTFKYKLKSNSVNTRWKVDLTTWDDGIECYVGADGQTTWCPHYNQLTNYVYTIDTSGELLKVDNKYNGYAKSLDRKINVNWSWFRDMKNGGFNVAYKEYNFELNGDVR